MTNPRSTFRAEVLAIGAAFGTIPTADLRNANRYLANRVQLRLADGTTTTVTFPIAARPVKCLKPGQVLELTTIAVLDPAEPSIVETARRVRNLT